MSKHLYKTLAEFDAAYSKLFAEFTAEQARCFRMQLHITDLEKQLAWHKDMHEKLIDTMNAGAREGKFPRN